MAHAKVQTGPGEPAWGWEAPGSPGRDRCRRRKACASTDAPLAHPPGADPAGPIAGAPPPPARPPPASAGRADGAGTSTGPAGPGPHVSAWSRLGLGLRPRGRGVAGAALILLSAAPSVRAQFPPDTLLGELEQRLLAPPACAPQCVALASGAVAITADRLRVVLVLDAVDTAVATLPQGGPGQWALESLRLDERPAGGAVRLAGGGPAVVVPPGRHRVILEGRVLGARLELAFGNGARNLTVEAPGTWSRA